MSIKSDRWIRRMAAEHKMIEPFSAEQVRVANGHKIVSYGTSSYGYDVRCAEEFKIFTNINSTIVDPKNFDEKSFVDFRGPVCIIPPNSFALASTVEFFRIPRSVLTVCLGKCVTGDTRVVDADTGAYIPITEMRFGRSTLALDSWRLKTAKVSAFMPQGRKEVFELRTRAGLRIRATANHPFRQLHGWTPLSELRPGDRIAAARHVPIFGKTPIADSEARLLGSNLGTDGSVPQAIFTAPEKSVRLFLQAYLGQAGSILQAASGSDVFLEFGAHARLLMEEIHHLLLRFGVVAQILEQAPGAGKPRCKIRIADQGQLRRFAARVGFTPGSVNQQTLDLDVLPLLGVRLRHECHGSAQAAFEAGHAEGEPQIDEPLWDVIEHIEPKGVEEVFDLSVPTLHNFLANGLIVHNSTYARCFRGDTRVALVNGTAPTLEDMARRHASGELFWGYSIGPRGRLIESLLDAPRFIGRDALLDLELDNGARVHATPDHLFMRRDGRMAEAHSLRPGDALMPLYRESIRGYESVYQPLDGHFLPITGLQIPARFSRPPEYRNHKIAAIRAIPGDHDVYCLTVPEAGNFALEAGIFVHNCGIIVNVTPLEPEWEGHVTLEFSNTTPLPAKIYANEGVAQMLFFESDEVCETSYRDRGGKYQGQRGVTLPKT